MTLPRRTGTPPTDVCPHCKANLLGAPIPEEHRKHCGNEIHSSRRIGIEEHDRVVRWRCPDCG